MELPPLELPPEINYVGLFLSFACNLDCVYCINDPAQRGGRSAMTAGPRREMPPDHWRHALGRFPVRDDLPLTFQGGEPLLYWGGRGLGALLAGTSHRFDLLTNLALPPERMARCLDGTVAPLKREAPYPTVRVSYHPAEMDRLWGNGIETLLGRCEALADLGFTVTPDKASSDVGLYLVAHPDNTPYEEPARRAAAGRVPFETKAFLGRHNGRTYGTYLYPFSTDLIEGGYAGTPLSCRCRTTEILVDPLGFVWPCHLYLYETWLNGAPSAAYAAAEARDFRMDETVTQQLPHPPAGHILDPAFTTAAVRTFHVCHQYGRCVGCDTKVKNDRFQSLDDHARPHTSVEIRDIRMPARLFEQLPEAERYGLEAAGVVSPDDDAVA